MSDATYNLNGGFKSNQRRSVLPITADVLQMLDEKERAYYEAEVADQNAWRKGR